MQYYMRTITGSGAQNNNGVWCAAPAAGG